MPHTHIIVYPIPSPGGGLAVGQRLLNYVWYRNVPDGHELDELMTDTRGFASKVSLPPGQVQRRYIDEMRATAAGMLAPAAAEVVRLTEQPYLQAVYDVCVHRMARGRVALIGDAASAPAARGGGHGEGGGQRLGAVGRSGRGRRRRRGGPAQEGARSAGAEPRLLDRVVAWASALRLTATWVPGDPSLRFGLSGPGR